MLWRVEKKGRAECLVGVPPLRCHYLTLRVWNRFIARVDSNLLA